MTRALIALFIGSIGLMPLAQAAAASAPLASAPAARSATALAPGSRIAWQGQEWYLHGVNMAWVNWARDFGGGLGDGVSSAGVRASVDERLGMAKATGVNVVRWWVFEGDGWQIDRDGSGMPTGLNAAIYQDFDAALELAEAHDISYVFVLFSAPSHIPQTWINDPGQRKQLADVLAPLFSRYADNPRVMSWEVFNEPDFDVWEKKVSEGPMREMIREVVNSVHANSKALATVGMAMLDGLPMVTGLGLDYYQAHWYDYMQPGDWCALCTNYDEVRLKHGLDAPLVIGEFYLGPDIESPHVRLEDFYSKGYAGAWAWSLFPEGTQDKLEVDWNSMRIFAGRHADLGPRSTPPLAPSSAPSTERLSFSSVGQAAEPRITAGGKMPVDVKITAIAGTRVLVDIEIYGPAGEQVHQQVFDNQAFGPGETKVYTTVWTVPGDATAGEYTIKVGVFTPEWGKVHDWNDRAATFTVSQ